MLRFSSTWEILPVRACVLNREVLVAVVDVALAANGANEALDDAIGIGGGTCACRADRPP